MNITKRFDEAVNKLYTAYHNNTLNAMDCQHCAVGNLCNNDVSWAGGRTAPGRVGGSVIYWDRYKPQNFINPTQYTFEELIDIERAFLFGNSKKGELIKFRNIISNNDVTSHQNTKQKQKELQFQGLCAVIEYLANLDNIPNPFNFDNLFNNDITIAEKELELITI